MHELGIAESVIDIVAHTAQQHGLSRVREVVIELGALSGVDAEALRFAFEVIAPGTIIEGARIELLEPPLLLRCRRCEREYTASIGEAACPGCSCTDFDVTQGSEMLVRSVTGE